jgi:hypothetical protein
LEYYFNAATPYHPSRETYYTQKAIDFGLTPQSLIIANPLKTILADKIEKHSIIPFKYNPYNVKSK